MTRIHKHHLVPAVILNGVEHSLAFACKHEYLHLDGVKARVASGWSVAAALLLPDGETCPPVPAPFPSVQEACALPSGRPRPPLPALTPFLPGPGNPLVTEGVTFPDGTRFCFRRGGEFYEGRIDDGALVVEGVRYLTLSPPLVRIAARPINGWRRWWVALPLARNWILADELRVHARTRAARRENPTP